MAGAESFRASVLIAEPADAGTCCAALLMLRARVYACGRHSGRQSRDRRFPAVIRRSGPAVRDSPTRYEFPLSIPGIPGISPADPVPGPFWEPVDVTLYRIYPVESPFH